MNPQIQTQPQFQDEGQGKLFAELPGLVGAIDSAIKDTAGKPLPFMLVIFGEVAMHCTNIHPPATALEALGEFIDVVRDKPEGQQPDAAG